MSWLSMSGAATTLTVAFVFLFAGVVLPAVWSTKPERRRAAAEVLAQLLGAWRRG